jgi:hypothetical protein
MVLERRGRSTSGVDYSAALRDVGGQLSFRARKSKSGRRSADLPDYTWRHSTSTAAGSSQSRIRTR